MAMVYRHGALQIMAKFFRTTDEALLVNSTLFHLACLEILLSITIRIYNRIVEDDLRN
jgi:hypothetical protein